MFGRGPISSAPISAGFVVPPPAEIDGGYRFTVPAREITFAAPARTVTFVAPARTIRFRSGGS